jgi:hypothetical protein
MHLLLSLPAHLKASMFTTSNPSIHDEADQRCTDSLNTRDSTPGIHMIEHFVDSQTNVSLQNIWESNSLAPLSKYMGLLKYITGYCSYTIHLIIVSNSPAFLCWTDAYMLRRSCLISARANHRLRHTGTQINQLMRAPSICTISNGVEVRNANPQCPAKIRGPTRDAYLSH